MAAPQKTTRITVQLDPATLAASVDDLNNMVQQVQTAKQGNTPLSQIQVRYDTAKQRLIVEF